ncbi:MAG: hypothetical protein Q9208_002610 [Pyrenodesmia sp. 3 TL-2023]
MARQTAGGNAAFHNFHNDYAHIDDPNERRRLALAEIDKAPFGWYHVRAVVVAGIGFFTDAYDIFAINLVTSMLGVVYWQTASSKPGIIPSHSDTAIKVATSGGTVLGQVGFGILADVVGRKKMYGLELILIIFATLAQSLSAASPAMSVVGLIIFWRVLMGIGIGGDYPLSSIITSEFATTKWRGAMMGAVFAMQGIGQLAAALVALIVTTGFKESLVTAAGPSSCDGVCLVAVDKMWRVVIGFGAVPGCIALYYRLTIPETPRYTFDVARDVEKAGEDVKAYIQGKAEGRPDEIRRVTAIAEDEGRLEIPKAGFKDFVAHYRQWRFGKVLLGTAGSWFFLDVAFYGLGLNNSIILGAIGYSKGDTMYEVFRRNAVGNLILVCAGAIPGYWVTVFTIDTLGRKAIQFMGFTMLTILFVVIGFAYDKLLKHNNALLALYVLAQFFFNFGPNATTFIVPGECFPTRYRSTSHGISAASGKMGAIIAQVVFGPLRQRGAPPGSDESPWLNHVMEIFALFMLCGLFTTFLIPETRRKTLEELAGEVPGTANYDPGSVQCCISADIDAVAGWLGSYGGEDSTSDISRGIFAGTVGVRRLLKMFDKYNIKTTWFIPGHSLDTFREECEMIRDAGHEIGLHGYSHENPTKMSLEQQHAIMDKTYKQLRDFCGKPPRGVVAPWWESSKEGAELMMKYGVEYDHSFSHHDCLPYYLRIGDTWTKIDYSQPPSHWMKPLEPGTETGFVEIPSSWSQDDLPPMLFIKNAPNSHGWVNTRDVADLWRDRFDYFYREYEEFCYTVTVHPDVSGQPQVILMLEKWVTYLLFWLS